MPLEADGDPAPNGEQRYYPFGESRITTAALPTDRLYSGQREIGDFSIGLYHYNARFYAPYLNRWIQPDTIVPSWYDPQSLNRYTYVNNNPINFTDPSGHCSDDLNIDDDECWKMYAKVVNALGSSRNQRISRDPKALEVLKVMDKYDLQSLLSMIQTRRPSGLSKSVSTNYDTRLWLVAFFGGLVSMENTSGKIDAVEAMARWVEFTVALHDGIGLGSGQVMDDLLLVENGFKKTGLGGLYDTPPIFQELGPKWFNDSGFASVFQDNDDQVFHAMVYMAVASDLPLGPGVAEGANIYHETIDDPNCDSTNDISSCYSNLTACSTAVDPLSCYQTALTNYNFGKGKSFADFVLGERAIVVGMSMNRSSSSTWGNWVRFGFSNGLMPYVFWPIASREVWLCQN